MKNFVWLFTWITGLIPQGLFFKRKTYYENASVQKRRIKDGAVIICNHTSLLDFMMIMFLFPIRKVHFMVAEAMYRKSKLFAWFLKCLGGVFVDRTSVDPSIYGASIDTLKKGSLLLIFPEGRIQREKGLLPFKPGAAFIASQANVPIIPMYTRGGYGIFKRARLMIGTPVCLNDIEWKNTEPTARLSEQTEFLRRRVEELGEKLEKELSDARKK